MGCVVLCADTESLIRPMMIGLEDTVLDGREWLVSIPNALEARDFIGSHDVDEAWVVSSDDLVGINLAAALRKDDPALPIYLIVFEASGSELSRATQAGVSGILTAESFCERFDAESRKRSFMSEIADIDVDAMMDEEASSTVKADPVPAFGSSSASTPTASSAVPSGRPSLSTPPSPESFKSIKKEGDGFVVAFLSGSGGAGKSTIAMIAACRSAAMGYKTAVVDCDLQFGDLRQTMGDVACIGIDEVLEDPESLGLIEPDADARKPVLVAAPERLERSEVLSAHMAELMNLCAAVFDVVFVNTGSSWTEGHAQLLERCDCSVFLIDQRASSVHACRHALDLCMRLGIASASFVYVLNRCKRGALFSAIDIANAMQGAHVYELRDGGQEVEEFLGAGLGMEFASGKNELCTSIDAMFEELLPAVAKKPSKSKGKTMHAAPGISGASGSTASLGRKGSASRRRGRQKRMDAIDAQRVSVDGHRVNPARKTSTLARSASSARSQKR